MRKALIFIFVTSVGLLAPSVQGENLLKKIQYDAIKTLNDAFFEEYKKLYQISDRLMKLSSYGDDMTNLTFRYESTFLDEAIEHVIFTMNLWEYEYRSIKWLPGIKDEFLPECLCELAKSLRLVKRKPFFPFHFSTPIKITIIQLSQPKYSSSLDEDILKELENAQIVLEAGTKLLDRISEQLPIDWRKCSKPE